MPIKFTDLIEFEERLRKPKSQNTHVVPRFVFSSFQYIMRHPAMGEFRVNPNETELTEEKARLERSPKTGIPLKETLLASSLLKYFFRIS